MKRMLLSVAVAVLGLTFVGGTACAGHYGHGHRGHHSGHGGHYRGHSGHYSGHRGYNGGYNSYRGHGGYHRSYRDVYVQPRCSYPSRGCYSDRCYDPCYGPRDCDY